MVRRSELLPDERILPLSLAVKAMIGVESLRTRPSGMVSFDNADGTKTIIGGSGTDQIATNAGDTQAPSRPTGLSATSTMQVALVHWDGTLEYGMVDDFDHIEIFAQPDGGDVLDIGYMRTEGELATGRLPVGSVVELWAVAADNAHDLQGKPSPNMSDESDHLVVTIDEPVDQNQIRETAEKLQKAADDAAAKADEAIKQGEQIRQDAQAGIDDARKQAQAAGDKADKVRSDLQAEVDANKQATDAAIAKVDAKADKAQNDLESQTTALKSSIAAVDAKADQVKAALDKSIADVDAKAQAASDKGDRLAGQISDMSTTVNGHTTKLDELSTRIEGVASDGQVTVKSLTSLQQTVTGLSSTVTQNTKTASDAMSKASQVEQTANSISANLSKNYTTTADADEKYAVKTELKATADGLQANITRSQQTADGAVTAANKAQATADGFGATLSKDYQTAKASDEKYSTKAELKATSDGLSSSLSSVKQTADGAVTAASKAQQTADVVSLNLSKNYATKSQADATYATQTSLKATSDSLTASINSTAKTASGAMSKATTLEQTANSLSSTITAQGKTLEATTKTANTAKATADSNTTAISQVKSTADGTVTRISNLEQNLDGFKTTVAKTYQDKAGMSNYATNSALKQTSDTITSQVSEVSKTASGAVSKVTSLEQTANGLSSKITEQGKILNATVTTANEAKSTADSNKTAISQVSTTAGNALSKASTVEQNLNGFKTTVSKTYTTKNDFNNLTIGGTNLLRGCGTYTKNNPIVISGNRTDSITYRADFIADIDTKGDYWFQCQTDGNWVEKHNTSGFDPKEKRAGIYIYNNQVDIWNFVDLKTSNPNKVHLTPGRYYIRFNLYSNGTDFYTLKFWNLKLEKGTKPTDWSPAPEDLQSAGDYATNSSLSQTANQIRGEVSEKYQSKNGMSSYATTSALTQKANEITGKVTEVAKTAQGNTTTISQVSQKADRINTTLSQQISGKADTSRVSSLEQNLDGFKASVAKTYQTKGDYPTKAEVQSRIDQSASSIKSTVGQTYTTLAATEALRKSATRTFTLTGAAGKAKWVKLGYLTSNGDDSSVLIHVYSGDGYNGRASQNAEFEIFVKDGWQQSESATSAFGVSVSRIRNADDVKVKVMAFSSTTCNIWAYMPWTHWNGHYTLQGDYKSWQDGPNCGGTRIQDAEPTSGTAQNLAYDTLSTRSYVDQTAKSVALGVVQSYKGSDGSGLATKSDITAAKNSITSSVSSTYATKTGVTQEISSKITQNNNSLDVKFSTKTETKNAQDTANTANSHASDAQSRIGSLEDCINMTSQGVRVGKRVNGKWSGWSALVNTGGSYDIFDGAGAKQATFSSGRLDLGKSSHNTNGIYVPDGGNWTSGWLCIDDYLVDCDHTRHIYACARGGLLCFKGRVALTNPNAAGDQRVIDGGKWYRAMQGKYSVYPYLDVDDDERDWPVTFKRSDNNLLAVGTLFIPRTTRDIWWYDPTRGKHTMWIDLNNLQIPMGNNVIG